MERPTLYETMLTNAQAIETKSRALGPGQMSRVRELTAVVDFGPLSSAGTIVVEAAPHAGYTGNWAIIATIAWAAIGAKQASIAGVQLAVRFRVSAAIVGDTCNAYLVGN